VRGQDVAAGAVREERVQRQAGVVGAGELPREIPVVRQPERAAVDLGHGGAGALPCHATYLLQRRKCRYYCIRHWRY